MINELFENNRAWAKEVTTDDPDFFSKLADQQAPEYLWIGCSDSRVPANQIIGLLPGNVFVHRNVANVVVHSDLNCLSVVQFAVDVLKVKHIIICGHYGCGGVHSALNNTRHGLVDNWLRHVQDVMRVHEDIFRALPEHRQWDVLCELNVIEQVENLCQTTIVQDAWKRGMELSIHGWVYSLKDGLLRDLGMSVNARETLSDVYGQAAAKALG